MPSVMRIGDMGAGICNSPDHDNPEPYITVFVSGADTVSADNLGMCFVGTIGVASCGHPTIALTGSPTVTGENIAIHRTGDTGANYGPYTALEGSPDVTAD